MKLQIFIEICLLLGSSLATPVKNFH
jgi:hypothetical protein